MFPPVPRSVRRPLLAIALVAGAALAGALAPGGGVADDHLSRAPVRPVDASVPGPCRLSGSLGRPAAEPRLGAPVP